MDTRYIKGVLYTLALLLIFSSGLFAQSWNLPDNRQNDRYFTDQFDIPRPALSMRSFDNTQNDSYQHQYSSTTYGVRQVLEKAYGIGEPQVNSVSMVFDDLANLWDEDFLAFNSDDNRDFNSRVLEARSFIALMSYIIEENSSIFNNVPDDYNLPSHSTAMNSLLSALEVADKSRYFRKNVSSSSPFKRSKPLMKVARAWDLYLALENAYQDLGNITTQVSLNDILEAEASV